MDDRSYDLEYDRTIAEPEFRHGPSASDPRSDARDCARAILAQVIADSAHDLGVSGQLPPGPYRIAYGVPDSGTWWTPAPTQITDGFMDVSALVTEAVRWFRPGDLQTMIIAEFDLDMWFKESTLELAVWSQVVSVWAVPPDVADRSHGWVSLAELEPYKIIT